MTSVRSPFCYLINNTSRGGRVVDRRELERIARRYDTVMSRAMLRALGFLVAEVAQGRPCPVVRVGHAAREGRRYRGLMECFRNARSPMDGLR